MIPSRWLLFQWRPCVPLKRQSIYITQHDFILEDSTYHFQNMLYQFTRFSFLLQKHEALFLPFTCSTFIIQTITNQIYILYRWRWKVVKNIVSLKPEHLSKYTDWHGCNWSTQNNKRWSALTVLNWSKLVTLDYYRHLVEEPLHYSRDRKSVWCRH